MTNRLAFLDSLIDDDENFVNIKEYISYWNPFVKNEDVIFLIKQLLKEDVIVVAFSDAVDEDYYQDWYRLTEKGKKERIEMLEEQGYYWVLEE